MFLEHLFWHLSNQVDIFGFGIFICLIACSFIYSLCIFFMAGTRSKELRKKLNLKLIQDRTSEKLSSVTLSTFNIFSRGAFKVD